MDPGVPDATALDPARLSPVDATVATDGCSHGGTSIHMGGAYIVLIREGHVPRALVPTRVQSLSQQCCHHLNACSSLGCLSYTCYRLC